MPTEETYRISLTIPELRELVETANVSQSIKDKANKMIVKVVHNIIKPSYKSEVSKSEAIGRAQILATETEEEKNARIERELQEEEDRFNKSMGF